MFPYLALALVPSVAFACVGSACCFRLRRFHLLRSFALVPSVALVCVGSVCCFECVRPLFCFSSCWDRPLLLFALVPSVAFFGDDVVCCFR